VEIVSNEADDRMARSDTFLILENRTYYRMRYPYRILDDYRIDWGNFLKLEPHSRKATVDALLEDRDGRRIGMLPIQYVPRNFDEHMAGKTASAFVETLEEDEREQASPKQVVMGNGRFLMAVKSPTSPTILGAPFTRSLTTHEWGEPRLSVR
jgi:hypothetical protein